MPSAGAAATTSRGTAAPRAAAARVALVLVALLLGALLPASAAQAVPPCGIEERPGCGGSGGGPGTPGGGVPGGGVPDLGGGFPCSPGCTHQETTSAALPPPSRCFQIIQGVGFPTYRAARDYAAVTTGLPPCPGQNDPGPPDAGQWGELIDVPLPTATIAPGRAITGLTAYLVVETPSELVDVAIADPLTGATYLLTLETDYEVDWGDGTVERGIDQQGEPYPGGPDEITHVYERPDTVDVVVRAEWTGTWRIAGQQQESPLGGSVPREHRIEDLPVDEVQAVRRR